jgi:hypothetical protein
MFRSGIGRRFDAEEVAMLMHKSDKISSIGRHLKEMAKTELPPGSNNHLLCSETKDHPSNQCGCPGIMYSLSDWFWNDYRSREYNLGSKFHSYKIKEGEKITLIP